MTYIVERCETYATQYHGQDLSPTLKCYFSNLIVPIRDHCSRDLCEICRKKLSTRVRIAIRFLLRRVALWHFSEKRASRNLYIQVFQHWNYIKEERRMVPLLNFVFRIYTVKSWYRNQVQNKEIDEKNIKKEKWLFFFFLLRAIQKT